MSTLSAPPRVLRAILRLALPGEWRDAVESDLHELYVARRADRGAAAAALWYGIETLSFAARFSVDRAVRAIRGVAGAMAAPSALDVKLGARLLARAPGLALVGGFGMAVAVALGTGAHAVINSYFYPEIPLHEGDRVIAIAKFDRRGGEDERLLRDFLAWQRELRSVVDLGAFRTVRRNLVSETEQGEPITLAEITASGFRMARVPPLLGRPLIDADERPGASPVVVIGHDVWRSRFAGDPAVVGRAIRIGRTEHTIVGVMPAEFGFPVNHRWWVPLRVDPADQVEPGTGPELDVFGRLAPGATKESAQAELAIVNRRLAADGPAEMAHREARIVPYTDIFLNSGTDSGTGPMAVVRFLIALLLVVVAMNVAVLVYARTVSRTGEIAVRTALGATRGRIVAQLFVEAFALSGLAALVGLGIVAIGLDMFDQAIADQLDGSAPFWIQPGLSPGTVLYALGLAMLSAVIVGVMPALRATGTQLRVTMGSLGSGGQAQLGPTWTALIVAQIAITVAVLPLALLKGGQTMWMAVQPPGFAASEYLTTRFLLEHDLEANRHEPAAADSARIIMTELLARLGTEPGVVGATVTGSPPWEGGQGLVHVDGADLPLQRVRVAMVDMSYFGLFGARVLEGRTFTAADAALPIPDRPVIVNRTFAAELLGDGDPVGRRIRYPGHGDEVKPWITIAGVIDDFPPGVRTPGEPSSRMMYHLELPGETPGGLLMVRLQGQPPEAFASTLRRIATSVDPTMQLTGTSALDALYRDYTRAGAQLALVIALIMGSVLLLAAAGIYALVSFTVTQRRREIGIRTALGAPPHLILRSVLARSARQLALGLGFGLAMAVALDLLSGGEVMSGNEMLLVPGTAAFMLTVGFIAAAGPARRALRIHPTQMLRAE